MLTLRFARGEYIRVGPVFLRLGDGRGQVEIENALVMFGPYDTERGRRWLVQVQQRDFKKPQTVVLKDPFVDGAKDVHWPGDDPRLEDADARR
jgi:hypothetical protein